MNNKNQKGIFSQQWSGFAATVVIGTVIVVLVFNALNSRVNMLNEQEKALVLQQFDLIQREQQLDARDKELRALENDLSQRETSLSDLEQDMQRQQALIESSQPELAAALLQQSYLNEFGGVDLRSGPPCEDEKRERYLAAFAHLDALYAAALDISGSNRFTLFVEQQRGNADRNAQGNCK